MKKIAIYLIAVSSGLCNTSLCAGSMGPTNISSNEWTGFFVGLNAGGWWTSNSVINTVGTPTFAGSGFDAGNDPIIMSQALAANATNQFSINTNGFIGGGQAGYNQQLSQKLIIGLDIDIDGLSQSQNDATITKNTELTGAFGTGSYPTSVSISKHIDYIGTIRGRLGILLKPTLLIYGTGGLAYGGVSLKTNFDQSANLSLGNFWPSFSATQDISQTHGGFSAGGGGEWMFRPNWSAKAEYLYSDLGTVNANSNLIQNFHNPQTSFLDGPFSAANMHASARFAQSMIRVGVNYHFA